MAAYGYMAKIGADTSGLQSALKDINSSLKSTDNELYKVNKSIKTAEQAGTERSDLLKQKEDVLGNAISETAEKLERLRSIEEQMKNAADNKNISAEQYRDYQRELGNTEAQLRQYQVQLAQTRQEQNNLSGSNQVVTASLQDVQTAFEKVSEDLSWFTDKLKTAADAALVYGKKMVKYSLDVGSAFEASMSKVQAYSGAVGDDFAALGNAAKNAGATTSKSAKEAADALGYMALAGWDTEEMLEGLMPIVRASEAGGADLKRTSDLVTDSMSAMGIATSDLTRYLDICTAAQSNSNTTLTGLLEAYVGCGGTLRNLNVPLEESAALLGNLANRGIKASEAGTSLNSILVNLIGANKSASDAMDALGVSAWDENGNFIGLSNTLKVLKGALENCTDQQKAFFEAKIGGKTQMDTLQALIAGVSDEYDGLYETLVNSNGALENTAKTMQDNLAGAMTTMRSALEALGVEFYDYLEEPATEAVNAVTEALRSLTDAIDKGELSEKLKKLSEKAGELIEKFVEFASEKGIDLVIDGLSKFTDLLSWLIDNLDTVSGLVKGLGAAFLTIKAGELAIDIMTLVGTISTLAAAAESGTVAATVLSAALNAIPCVAFAAAVIGAGVALASWIDSAAEAKMQAASLKTELDKTYLSFTNTTAVISKMSDEIDRNTEKIDKNCDKAKDLWEQLKDLCDEHGNVTGSYEDAQSVITELNELTDSHITLIGSQIQGYNDLCTSMDNYIETLRITAKMEAAHDAYVEAVGHEDELHENVVNAEKTERNARSKRIAAETARIRGGITNVRDLGVIPEELVQTEEWQDFSKWYNGAYKHEPNPLVYDDYISFLSFQEQLATNAASAARGAERTNNEVKEKYEALAAKAAPESQKNPAQLASEESAEKNRQATIKNAEEKDAEEHSDLADVIRQLENTDNDYSFGKIASEKDYYAQLENITDEYKELFKKYPDTDEFKVFKRYLDKVKSYKDKQNKSGSNNVGKKSAVTKETDPERTASQAISSKKTELENKKAKDNNYSDSDYYNDLEKWAETEIDHSTEAYIKLDTEIANGRKKLLEDAEKKEQTTAKENARSRADQIKSRAEEENNYDTSSPEYWETLEKAYINADWTELEKGTDSYLNLGKEIEKGKKKAEISEAEKNFKKKIEAEKKRLERLVEEGSLTKVQMWTALEEFYNDDMNFSEAERNTSDYAEYAEKIAEEKADAEARQKNSDKKEAEKNFTNEYDDLADNRKNDLISEEEYQKELLALKEKYAEYGIDISEHIAEKEKEINEKHLEDIRKKYDDLDRKIDSRALELTKGSLDSGKLYEEKDLANGGKKKVFNDLSKKKAEIEKYTKDLEALRKTDIPQELMNEILAMDYDERRDVISELLKMSEKNRDLYYSDYTEWHKAAQEAAELEYSDEKTDIENELNSALAGTADIAGTYGEDAAEAYLEGWNKVMKNEGLDLLVNPLSKKSGAAVSNRGAISGGSSPHDNSIRIDPSTPVTINIGGENVIKKTFFELFGLNRITDGKIMNL